MPQWSEKTLEIISVLLKSVETCFVSYVVYPREHSMCVWEDCVFFYGGIYCSKGFPHISVGKESACNAGDPGLIAVSGRSPGEGIGYPFQYSWAFLVAELVKKSACSAGDLGSIPGLGRSPGEGKGYPLQYSGLENSIDYIVHGVTRVSHDGATFTLSLF